MDNEEDDTNGHATSELQIMVNIEEQDNFKIDSLAIKYDFYSQLKSNSRIWMKEKQRDFIGEMVCCGVDPYSGVDTVGSRREDDLEAMFDQEPEIEIEYYSNRIEVDPLATGLQSVQEIDAGLGRVFDSGIIGNDVDYPKQLTREGVSEFSESSLTSLSSLNYVREFNLPKKIENVDLTRVTQIHSCKICSYSGKNSLDLKRHMPRNFERKPYSCSLCEFKSARVSALQKHVDTTHGSQVYHKCTECTFSTRWLTSLKRHIVSHKEKSKSFKSRNRASRVVEKSVASIDPEDLALRGMIEVPLHTCISTVCDVDQLKNENPQMNSNDMSSIDQVEDYRDKCYARPLDLTHGPQVYHKCTQTHSTFSTCWLGNLKRHIDIHKDRGRERSFTSRSRPSRGVEKSYARVDPKNLVSRGVIEEPPVTCTSSVRVVDELKKESSLIHSKDMGSIYQSEDYHKCHVRPLDLGQLSKGKGDSGVYTCTICYFITSSEICLEQHMIGHFNVFKPQWACGLCLFRGHTESALRSHVNALHTKRRLLECTKCPFKTVWTDYMRRHYLKKHNIHQKFKEM